MAFNRSNEDRKANRDCVIANNNPSLHNRANNYSGSWLNQGVGLLTSMDS